MFREAVAKFGSPFNLKEQKAMHRFRVSSNPAIAIGHRHNYVYVDTEHALIALIAVLDHGYTVDKYMGYE